MDFRAENPWNSNLELHTFSTHTETGLICYTGLSKVMYGNLKYLINSNIHLTEQV